MSMCRNFNVIGFIFCTSEVYISVAHGRFFVLTYAIFNLTLGYVSYIKHNQF